MQTRNPVKIQMLHPLESCGWPLLSACSPHIMALSNLRMLATSGTGTSLQIPVLSLVNGFLQLFTQGMILVQTAGYWERSEDARWHDSLTHHLTATTSSKWLTHSPTHLQLDPPSDSLLLIMEQYCSQHSRNLRHSSIEMLDHHMYKLHVDISFVSLPNTQTVQSISRPLDTQIKFPKLHLPQILYLAAGDMPRAQLRSLNACEH